MTSQWVDDFGCDEENGEISVFSKLSLVDLEPKVDQGWMSFDGVSLMSLKALKNLEDGGEEFLEGRSS